VSVQEYKHWFAFSFAYMDQSRNVQASVYIGYPDRQITLARIDGAKKDAEVPETSVLLAVSYLGCMTKAEFSDG
jgi:hypothetical protein